MKITFRICGGKRLSAKAFKTPIHKQTAETQTKYGCQTGGLLFNNIYVYFLRLIFSQIYKRDGILVKGE